MPANTPEDKKKAVESKGGKYNEKIEGHYVEVKGTVYNNNLNGANIKNYQSIVSGSNVQKDFDFDMGNKTPGTGNYTENLGGEFIEGDYYQQDNIVNFANVREFTINHGQYTANYRQLNNNNNFTVQIEVDGDNYELMIRPDPNNSNCYLGYIPGIIEENDFDAYPMDNPTDVCFIEWSVVRIQEQSC